MITRRRWNLAGPLFVATLLGAPVLWAHSPPRPALFGVGLAHARRPALERALVAAHMTLKRGGKHRWYDVYHVNGALKHATILAVSFTAHGRFAKATYVFPSFISTKRLGQVVHLVMSKYGPPNKTVGYARIGPVRVIWKLPNAFEIIVKRRWPNPTTFLTIENHRMLVRMKQEQKHSLAQSGAF